MNSSSVKRWISESYSHCWKVVKYAEDAGKPKNVKDFVTFSSFPNVKPLLFILQVFQKINMSSASYRVKCSTVFDTVKRVYLMIQCFNGQSNLRIWCVYLFMYCLSVFV